MFTSAGHLRISSSTSPLHIVHILSKRGVFGLLYLPNSSISGKVPPCDRANTLRYENFTTFCTNFSNKILFYVYKEPVSPLQLLVTI